MKTEVKDILEGKKVGDVLSKTSTLKNEEIGGDGDPAMAHVKGVEGEAGSDLQRFIKGELGMVISTPKVSTRGQSILIKTDVQVPLVPAWIKKMFDNMRLEMESFTQVVGGKVVFIVTLYYSHPSGGMNGYELTNRQKQDFLLFDPQFGWEWGKP